MGLACHAKSMRLRYGCLAVPPSLPPTYQQTYGVQVPEFEQSYTQSFRGLFAAGMHRFVSRARCFVRWEREGEVQPDVDSSPLDAE